MRENEVKRGVPPVKKMPNESGVSQAEMEHSLPRSGRPDDYKAKYRAVLFYGKGYPLEVRNPNGESNL